MTATETLATIKPGKNYPASVTITEIVDGKPLVVKFLLQSYISGMYCALYVGEGGQPTQTGDYNNLSFVTKLKRDIANAIKRGATVEFGSILNVKSL